jgi:hypothetical protein
MPLPRNAQRKNVKGSTRRKKCAKMMKNDKGETMGKIQEQGQGTYDQAKLTAFMKQRHVKDISIYDMESLVKLISAIRQIHGKDWTECKQKMLDAEVMTEAQFSEMKEAKAMNKLIKYMITTSLGQLLLNDAFGVGPLDEVMGDVGVTLFQRTDDETKGFVSKLLWYPKDDEDEQGMLGVNDMSNSQPYTMSLIVTEEQVLKAIAKSPDKFKGFELETDQQKAQYAEAVCMISQKLGEQVYDTFNMNENMDGGGAYEASQEEFIRFREEVNKDLPDEGEPPEVFDDWRAGKV